MLHTALTHIWSSRAPLLALDSAHSVPCVFWFGQTQILVQQATNLSHCAMSLEHREKAERKVNCKSSVELWLGFVVGCESNLRMSEIALSKRSNAAAEMYEMIWRTMHILPWGIGERRSFQCLCTKHQTFINGRLYYFLIGVLIDPVFVANRVSFCGQWVHSSFCC